MLNFIDNDEGFTAITKDDELVCVCTHTDCTRTTALGEGRQVKHNVQKQKLPREKWRLHFTGRAVAPEELDAIVKKLKDQ